MAYGDTPKKDEVRTILELEMDLRKLLEKFENESQLYIREIEIKRPSRTPRPKVVVTAK